jgi:hypothetical protein
MLAEFERLDDRELNYLLSSLEARVRSALAIGDSEIVHCLLDQYLAANEEFDRRLAVWKTPRSRQVLAMN